MISPALRDCCQRSLLDGETPKEHYERCDARREDPEIGALFDLPAEPQQGGQHP